MEAVRMTEKHNDSPTAPKRAMRFRKTISLDSASGWDGFHLGEFHVNFALDQQSDLTQVIGGVFYELNPENDRDQRMMSSKCPNPEGIATILTESELMTEDDLRLLYDDDEENDDDISANFTRRVLRDFYTQ